MQLMTQLLHLFWEYHVLMHRLLYHYQHDFMRHYPTVYRQAFDIAQERSCVRFSYNSLVGSRYDPYPFIIRFIIVIQLLQF